MAGAYYLASYTGSGTTLDTFRPVASDGQVGWSAIDLRPDGGATLGGGGLNACLLYLPTAVVDSRLILVAMDAQDVLGPVTKNVINAKLGTAVTASRFDLIVAELLLSPPVNGWKPLLSEVDGVFRIWLNGVIYSQPVIAGGTSFSENWNCANSASITCQLTWTKIKDTTLQISGQLVNLSAPSDGTWSLARAENDLATSNHTVFVTVVSMSLGNSTNVSAAVLFRKDASATLTFYEADALIGSANTHRLFKVIGDTYTQLGANSATAPTNGEVLQGRASGSTIGCFKDNVVQVSVTDTSITGNLRCGVGLFEEPLGSTGVVSVDNWSVQDVASTEETTTAPYRVRLRQY